MSGVIRFPNNMSADAQDLIEWLLAKNPSERPEEVSEIKKHHYFNSIHWGRIAKKQAIPPWIPDLNKWHAPKKFTSIPLNTVFLRENKGQKFKSASYNPRPDEGQFKTDIYAHDQKSNMVHREYNRREAGNDLYLDGKYFFG